MPHTHSKLARVIFDNSLLLLAGTIAAVVWANLDLGSYDRMTHPLHFLVNDVGMVFFFALATKEVFEATERWRPLVTLWRRSPRPWVAWWRLPSFTSSSPPPSAPLS